MPSEFLVVIPCLNEERHLPTVLDTVLRDPLAARTTIVAADGGSADRTRDIVRDYAARYPSVVLLDNPARLQSAGVNLATSVYGEGTDFIIRIDAHADYPEGFCSRLVEVQRTTGADSVVVSMNAKGETTVQRAAAVAQVSVFGTGGSAHRSASAGKWVEHGHHALFSTPAFIATGGYNESFSHNEDAEFDARFAALGYRIYLAPISIDYYPRRSLAALWRQYYNFGKGRARTLLLHRQMPNLRRLVVICLAPLLALALLTPWAPIAALPLAGWLALVATFGIRFCMRHGTVVGVLAAVAGATMQIAWSAGFHSQILASIKPGFGRPAPTANS